MTEAPLQVAIVGAGVSGLYTAWRLLESGLDPSGLAVFEASDRIGGRLWSVPMHEKSSLPAELGGMFFSDQQALVHGLCLRALELDMEPVVPRPDFAWLRARRFSVEQFADPAVLPYGLAQEEKNLNYYALLSLAINRIAPELKRLWPRDPGGSREETVIYLREHQFDGQPLYKWGFWNLVARVISNEALLALRDIISSYSLFDNGNAYDVMILLVVGQAGNWHRLKDGFQGLPERLAEELLRAGVGIHLQRSLCCVTKDHDSGVVLALEAPEGPVQIKADHLVLAMPQLALDSLVTASPDLQDSELPQLLEAVKGVPACKIFLTFDIPWWQDVFADPSQIQSGTYAVSHTDLPLRQCYYLGVDPVSGDALMMASYVDGDAVDFWQALMYDAGPTGPKQQLCSVLGRQAQEEILRQLSEMHGMEVPLPTGGIFVNWDCAPFGGGWHKWQPGWKSWETTVAMRRPVAGTRLYVCGEAYSQTQSWVQGALASAEAMLQQEFGLSPPAWMDEQVQYMI